MCWPLMVLMLIKENTFMFHLKVYGKLSCLIIYFTRIFEKNLMVKWGTMQMRARHPSLLGEAYASICWAWDLCIS